jgi:tRNA(Ile)-lysidine synthase
MSDPVETAVARALAQIGPGVVGVACSGGADSMALADATIERAGAAHVVVATIDHGLVPESAEVAAEVAAWARSRGAAAVVRRVEVERRASIEAAARDARYAALDAIATEVGLVAVLTGHTARDQVETVLLRLVRGTGPRGLAGIPPRRGLYIRPLLAVSREDTVARVARRDLPVWADPMNEDQRLARIRARTQVLPALRRENPQLDQALLRLAASAAEWAEVIDALALPFAQFPIDCAALAAQPAAIRKRALAVAIERTGINGDPGAVHIERLDTLVTAASRGEVAVDLPGLTLVRSYDRLAPRGPETSLGGLTVPSGHTLRAWKPGDRMCPSRLRGRSRKLSDLFIDAKVPRDMRKTARVLLRDHDLVIVWAEFIGVAFGEPVEIAPLAARSVGSF